MLCCVIYDIFDVFWIKQYLPRMCKKRNSKKGGVRCPTLILRLSDTITYNNKNNEHFKSPTHSKINNKRKQSKESNKQENKKKKKTKKHKHKRNKKPIPTLETTESIFNSAKPKISILYIRTKKY